MTVTPLHVLVASLALSVGSVPGDFTTSASSSTACGLITRQEAAAALGAAVPAGAEKAMTMPLKGGSSIKTQSCFFGTEVSVTRFELGASASTLFGQYRQSLMSTDDYQNVKGIGDEAFMAKGQIAVRKGQTGLIIDVGQNRGGGAAEVRKEKGLATLAVGRL
jgi:hypothetical protein